MFEIGGRKFGTLDPVPMLFVGLGNWGELLLLVLLIASPLLLLSACCCACILSWNWRFIISALSNRFCRSRSPGEAVRSTLGERLPLRLLFAEALSPFNFSILLLLLMLGGDRGCENDGA